MKNILFIFIISSITLVSCRRDPKQDCFDQVPSIQLVNFDTLDLQSIILYRFNNCCQYDSLESIYEYGSSFTFPNGIPDTFSIIEPITPFSRISILWELNNNNYKIKMRNNVEINISNLIQNEKQCTIPYGHNYIFCPCDVQEFDITGINCNVFKYNTANAVIIK